MYSKIKAVASVFVPLGSSKQSSEYRKYLFFFFFKTPSQHHHHHTLATLLPPCCSVTWLKLYDAHTAPFLQTTMFPWVPHSTIWKCWHPSCEFIHALHFIHIFPQICLTSFIHLGLPWPWPAIKLKFCGFKQCLAVQCLFVPVSCWEVNQKPISKQCCSTV